MKLAITEQDFQDLWDTSMKWGKDWRVKSGRFAPEITYDWKYAYWLNCKANLIMARAYLNEKGYESQASWDEGMASWVLLTNYESEAIK